MRPVFRQIRLVPLVAIFALPLVQPSQGREPVDARFRTSIDATNIRENMRRMTTRPQHVGSAYDWDNAEWILARFRESGWDAETETFDVPFSTPKERMVEMTALSRVRAALNETPRGIEQGRYAEAEREIARSAEAFHREARIIDAAVADLERVARS